MPPVLRVICFDWAIDPLVFDIQLIYDGHISCWACYDDTAAHPEEGLCQIYQGSRIR